VYLYSAKNKITMRRFHLIHLLLQWTSWLQQLHSIMISQCTVDSLCWWLWWARHCWYYTSRSIMTKLTTTKLMTSELAILYNWKGKGGMKRAFSATGLQQIVCGKTVGVL